MIISDDQRPDSPRKSLKSGTGSTIRPAETPYDPPPYDTVASSPPASLTSPLASPMSIGPNPNYDAIPRSMSPGSDAASAKRARRRFMSGFAIALITYLTLACFLSAHDDFHMKIPEMGHEGKHKNRPPVPGYPPDDLPGPTKDDGEIIECTTGESWSAEPPLMASRVPWKIQEEHVAYTTFSMPLDAPNHYFLSRGQHAAGVFTLEEDEGSDCDKISVRVQASWRHDIAMQSSQLCLLRKQNGSIGLGIYTPGREWSLDRRLDIQFVLRVQLPIKNAPLQLNSLEAGLSQFEMNIVTKERVEYGNLVFATSNAAIHSLGAVARKLVFVTSNGPILGTYNVTKSMVITTSNGQIDINVNAFNNDISHPTSVTATTRNGRVDVNTSLYYTREPVSHTYSSVYGLPQDSNGAFKLDFITSNGGIAVDFKEAPIGNAVSLSMTTSNADIDLYLHPTYEGKVSAVAGGSGSIKIDAKEPKTEDPTGRGRERIVEIRRVWPGMVTGAIAWDENNRKRGELVMTSSNGVCTLHI